MTFNCLLYITQLYNLRTRHLHGCINIIIQLIAYAELHRGRSARHQHHVPGYSPTYLTVICFRCTEVRHGLSRRRWQQISSSPNGEHRSPTENGNSKQRRGSRRKHLQYAQQDDDEDVDSSAALTTDESSRRRQAQLGGDYRSTSATATINSAISSVATAAWRRLVAGFGLVADDGRRVFTNCRHHASGDGVCVGLLGRTAGRSYDLMTN